MKKSGDSTGHLSPNRPWLAGIFSGLMPGLGQLYVGRPGRAGLFFFGLLGDGTNAWGIDNGSEQKSNQPVLSDPALLSVSNAVTYKEPNAPTGVHTSLFREKIAYRFLFR